MSARLFLLAVLPLLGIASPTAAHPQSVADLLESIRRGGGWVRIPVEDGSGHLLTTPLPTLGLRISGCAQVWGGHSGEWDIQARDTQGSGRMHVRARVGQHVPFSYDTGILSQLSVAVRWSEPRDTTFLLWVGLDGPTHSGSAACEPFYAEPAAAPSLPIVRPDATLPPRRGSSMLMRPSP